MSEHVHRYARYRGKDADLKNPVYFCTHATCYHKLQKGLLVGKLSVCHSCGKSFPLDNYALKTAFPKCLHCRDTKKSSGFKEVRGMIDNLLEDLAITEEVEEQPANENI